MIEWKLVFENIHVKLHRASCFMILALLSSGCSPDKKSESLPVSASNFDEMNNLGLLSIKPEKLEYEISYGLVKGGKALYETWPNLVEISGEKCWKTTIIGQTAGSVAWFSHVADTFYNFVDSAKTRTVLTERRIQEQRYSLHETTKFTDDSAFTYSRKRPNPIKRKLPGGVALGPVGALQAMRFLPYENMQKYDTANVSFFMHKRTYRLRIVYLGTEKIKSKYGQGEAFKVTPVLPANSMMAINDNAYIWISADENRIPVQSKAETRFGNIKVDLKKVHLY